MMMLMMLNAWMLMSIEANVIAMATMMMTILAIMTTIVKLAFCGYKDDDGNEEKYCGGGDDDHVYEGDAFNGIEALSLPSALISSVSEGAIVTNRRHCRFCFYLSLHELSRGMSSQ